MSKIMGEVITWSAGRSGVRVNREAVKEALEKQGLDVDVAKDIKPRTALMRCLREMQTERICRIVSEDKAKVVLQLTGEKRDTNDKSRLNYKYEATIILHKLTGEILASEGSDLADKFHRLMTTRMASYNALDISNMVQRLFQKKADLFPMRDQGGVYFVPVMHSDYIDSVQKFYESIGGNVKRFPVPDNSEHARKSVKDTLDEGMKSMVDELMASIKLVNADSREATTSRYTKRIKGLQFKLESYKEYLSEKTDEIRAGLKQARTLLAEKITLMAEVADSAGK